MGEWVCFVPWEGVEPQSETVHAQADKYKIPRIAFVNKMDRSGADFWNVVSEIKSKLNHHPCPIQIPLGSEEEFKGIIDLVRMKALVWQGNDLGEKFEVQEIPPEFQEQSLNAREEMISILADYDELLADLYLEEKEPEEAQILKAMRKATLSQKVMPVLCGSAFKNKGIQPLLDAITFLLPSPLDRGSMEGVDGRSREKFISRQPSEDDPFSGVAFKIASDPFVGTLTYFRVYSGTVKSGSIVYNPLKKKKERVQKILKMHANKREELSQARAGDIVALVGPKETITGETLCLEQNQIIFDLMEFPKTVISTAIEAKTTEDHDKLEKTLLQLKTEDPSFRFQHNVETGQLLIYGMGELHLEIIVDRLEREFGIGINIGQPQVSYRETISCQAEGSRKFEKEIGDKIQKGHCILQVEPLEDYQEEVVFDSKLSKRDMPLNLQKAIEKSIQETSLGGILAGHALLNLKVTLVGGVYEENEDSKSQEAVYAIAAGMAFQQACRKAKPIMMEPLMDLEIVTPVEYAGDIISDLNARRGNIVNMGPRGKGKEAIKAEVLLSKMFGYSTDLRSKSQGRATFSLFFKHYTPLSRGETKELLESRGIYMDRLPEIRGK